MIPVFDIHSHFLINAFLLRKRFERRHGHAFLWNPFRNAYDLPRARAGGVAGAIFTIYEPGWPALLGGGMKAVRAMRRRYDRMLDQCGGEVVPCTSAAQVRAAFGAGTFAAPLAVEGMHVIDGDAANVRVLRDTGVRMGTIVHFVSTPLADACWGPRRHGGLSARGREVVREMQRLGMLVDLAHADRETFWTAIDLAQSPYVVSHSGAKNAGAGSRGLDDEQLHAIRDLGGVAGVIFFPWYLKRHSIIATIDLVARHIAYIADTIGVDHVCIGTDADSNIWLPFDFKDVSRFPSLTDALGKHGFSEPELRKIYSDNFLRVMEQTDPKFHAGQESGPAPE